MFVLAARVLLAPVHLWQDESEAASQRASGHDHPTYHHDSDGCSICKDLLLTKHVGPGPAVSAPLAERIELPNVEVPAGRRADGFALATGGPRGPPLA
jgi:hypothetical protein